MPRASRRAARRPKRGGAVKSTAAGADNSRVTGPAGFELPELRRLIRLVQETGIGELEVTAGGRTIRISAAAHAEKAAPQATVHTIEAPAPPAAEAGRAAASASNDHLVAIASPMVGTFYRAPAPDADPYVEVGDLVEV